MENVEARSKEYSRAKNKLAFIGIILPILFLAAILFSGVSLRLSEAARALTQNFYAGVGAYLLILGAAYYIFTLPLGFYSGFILEHKFNLSTQKLKEWLWDEAKGIAVSGAIALPLLLGLYFLLKNFPDIWWLLAGAFWIFFTVILSKFAPVILLPLFFKQKPLEDTELKARLLALALAAGTKVENVFELDLSKKTKKANAALTGIGRTRRILLGDTLLKHYTQDEIEVVMAHELGHHKLMHIWKLLTFDALATFAGFYVTSIAITFGAHAFGFEGIYDIGAFPVLALLISALGIVVMPFQNGYSRRLERGADAFALDVTKKPEAFISAMTKLSRQNLSDPDPSKFIEIMLYSHPPISKRIKMARLHCDAFAHDFAGLIRRS